MPRVIPKKEQSAEKFSRRFRMLMAFHDLTLKDIAEFTENAISTVGTWKNGRYPSSQKTVDKLCEIFQVSADYLLRGKKDDATASAWSVEDMSAQVLQQPQLMGGATPAFYPNRVQATVPQPQPVDVQSQVQNYLMSLLAQNANNPQKVLEQLQQQQPQQPVYAPQGTAAPQHQTPGQ